MGKPRNDQSQPAVALAGAPALVGSASSGYFLVVGHMPNGKTRTDATE